MPLLEIDNILDLLACPVCGHALTGSAESLTCSSGTCHRVYRSIGKRPTPILIDSDASIVDVTALFKTAGDSQIERGGQGWFGRLAGRLATGRNETAENYAQRLARDVVAETDDRRARLLIVGGGEVGSGIESLYGNEDIDLIAFDIYGSGHCQFIADGHQ